MHSEVVNKLGENTKAEFRELSKLGNTSEVETGRKETQFDYIYFEVSSKTGEGIEASLAAIVERVVKDRSARKSEARRERDFGMTIIDPHIDTTGVSQRNNECCQRGN